MSRYVEVKEDHLLVALRGWTHIWALAGEIVVPYSCILRASAGPALMAHHAWKMAGTDALLGDMKHGHYRKDGRWYFFSFDHEDRTLNLELKDFHWGGRVYAGMALQVENPEELAAVIQGRTAARREGRPSGD